MIKINAILISTVIVLSSCNITHRDEKKISESKVSPDVTEQDQISKSKSDTTFEHFSSLFKFKDHREISLKLAEKFLAYDSTTVYKTKFYADSIGLMNGCEVYFYTSTCGVGGICTSLFIAQFLTGGFLESQIEILSKFGDGERQTNKAYNCIKNGFEVYDYILECSIETFDTLRLDTTKITIYRINENCKISEERVK